MRQENPNKRNYGFKMKRNDTLLTKNQFFYKKLSFLLCINYNNNFIAFYKYVFLLYIDNNIFWG